MGIFFHLRALEIPSVASEDRFTVSRLALPNYYRLVIRHGYNDEILSNDVGGLVLEQIRRYLAYQSRNGQPDMIRNNTNVEESDTTTSENVIGELGSEQDDEHLDGVQTLRATPQDPTT